MAPKVGKKPLSPPENRDVRRTPPVGEPRGRGAGFPAGVAQVPGRVSSAADAQALQRIAGNATGRVGHVLGRGSVGSKVTVAGVSDTVVGHLGRTLDEMNPPALTALEGLLRSVV